jgi:hypothetical protein
MRALIASSSSLLCVFACSSVEPSAPAVGATCIDPRADLLARTSCDPQVVPGCDALEEANIEDLDGDGVGDRLLAPQMDCGATGNCPYAVYLSGRGCSRYAGQVGGAAVRATARRHAGVRDISTYAKGGCVGAEGQGATWAFDGKEYRVVDAYGCECPWLDSGAGAIDPKRVARRDARCPSVP